MVDLPAPVARIILRPDSHKILSCVSPDGKPHSIVTATLTLDGPNRIVVGEVWMYRATPYIENNPNVEFLVWYGRDAYSIKAVAKERITSGPTFDKMSKSLDKYNMAVVAIWEFEVQEVWDESASSNCGTQVV